MENFFFEEQGRFLIIKDNSKTVDEKKRQETKHKLKLEFMA